MTYSVWYDPRSDEILLIERYFTGHGYSAVVFTSYTEGYYLFKRPYKEGLFYIGEL